MDLKELKSRVKKYSNLSVSSKPDVLGANPKLFFLVDIMKSNNDSNFKFSINDMVIMNKTLNDVAYCEDLFRTLRSKNNYYVTAFNELSDGKNGEPYIPEKIPVLGKSVRNNENGVFGEIVGSRLSQLLGYDTVYNFAPTFKSDSLCLKNPGNYEEILRRKTIFSVDFLAYGWDYYTFNDIIGGRGTRNNNSLKYNLNIIENILPLAFRSKCGFSLNDEMINNIKRAYVAQYLYRVALCGDTDYFGRNAGVMYNSNTKEVRLLPNYDMECCFDNLSTNQEIIDKLENNLRDTISLCFECYPDILQNFIRKVKALHLNGKLERCLRNSLSMSEELIDNKVNVLNYYLNQLSINYENCINLQVPSK